MSIKVNRADVSPEESRHHTVWRHLRRDGPVGVGVGVVTFKELPNDVDPETLAEAHDVPEIHYVLSGHGVLLEEGEQILLRAGDAVVTPAGRRHALWSTGHEPFTMIYVAISPTADAWKLD